MTTTTAVRRNPTEEKILKLLGQGIEPGIVANAVGVTQSAISQYLSDAEFSAAVAELRFSALSRHNDRDDSYDSIEEELIEKLRDLIPLMHRPMEVLKAIQVINAAKRRGSSAPAAITQQQTVINLTLPVQLIQKFNVESNSQNQVTRVGNIDLITIQSSNVANLAKEAKNGSPAVLPGTEKTLPS